MADLSFAASDKSGPGQSLPTSDFRDYGARRQALGNNRSFLLALNTDAVLGQLWPPTFAVASVPITSANTITCTSAYQPNPPQFGKAAITAGILLFCAA